MLVIRSLFFWSGLVISLVFFLIAGLLVFPFSPQIRFRVLSGWARFCLFWMRVTCELDYVVDGRENIPDKAGIVFCKHQSNWDSLVLQDIFPMQTWVLKRMLLWIPFLGWGLAMLNPVAIDRSAGRQALNQLVEQGTERLKEGRWMVIFPEGTRIAPGKKGKYHMGGSILAQKSGASVVPVAHNAGEFWPRRGLILRSGTIQVSIGPVIESKNRSASEINKLAETWIEDKVKEISTIRLP